MIKIAKELLIDHFNNAVKMAFSKILDRYFEGLKDDIEEMLTRLDRIEKIVSDESVTIDYPKINQPLDEYTVWTGSTCPICGRQEPCFETHIVC